MIDLNGKSLAGLARGVAMFSSVLRADERMNAGDSRDARYRVTYDGPHLKGLEVELRLGEMTDAQIRAYFEQHYVQPTRITGIERLNAGGVEKLSRQNKSIPSQCGQVMGQSHDWEHIVQGPGQMSDRCRRCGVQTQPYSRRNDDGFRGEVGLGNTHEGSIRHHGDKRCPKPDEPIRWDGEWMNVGVNKPMVMKGTCACGDRVLKYHDDPHAENAIENADAAVKLFLSFNGKRHPVSSVAEAQRAWDGIRDAAVAQGVGSSDLGQQPLIVDSNGKRLHALSWNGSLMNKKAGAPTTGTCYNCSHTAAAHANGACAGEGGKACAHKCATFVKRDSDGIDARKNSGLWRGDLRYGVREGGDDR